MASAELRTSLEKFAAFARSLHGDEKSEAQGFLERFFRALGHSGVMEAGATFEFRIAKKPGSAQLELIIGRDGSPSRPKNPGPVGDTSPPRGGKKFADLLWPERVLIEAFDYWTHIVPHRPPYVILCNFDEFWICDFNQQLFDPVDRVSLRELPDRASAFNFLLPQARRSRAASVLRSLCGNSQICTVSGIAHGFWSSMVFPRCLPNANACC